MDYEELITIYKNGDLDISNLKYKLEISRSLVGRPKYRAVGKVFDYISIFTNMINLCTEKERFENKEKFYKEAHQILESEFDYILNDVRECKAWRYMNMDQRLYSKEIFLNSSLDNKIRMNSELQLAYYKFLDLQEVVDVRDCFKDGDSLSDKQIENLMFIMQMYEKLRNEKVKNEFFCIDSIFIESLLKFKKSKKNNLDDFIARKGKKVKDYYEDNQEFFTYNDYIDIINNIITVSDVLNIDTKNIIGIYSEISETREEKKYLKELNKLHTDVVNKIESYKALDDGEIEKYQQNKERQDKANIQNNKDYEELAKNNLVVANSDKKKEIENNMPIQKERVVPVLFYWFGDSSKDLVGTITRPNVDKVFEKLELLQTKKSAKIKMFVITNANKTQTIKIYKDFIKLGKDYGLDGYIEGVYGSYSSFIINESGMLKTLSSMSEENKKKILKLVSGISEFDKIKIDESKEDYLRIVFDEKKTPEELSQLIKVLSNNDNIKKQPLRFMPFEENKVSGIDVLLNSQLKGIEQMTMHFKEKYDIDRLMSISIADFEKFVENKNK